MSEVLAVLGPAASPPTKSDLAALGCASALASADDASGALDILLLGPHANAAAADVAKLSARTVYACDHADLEPFTAEAFASAIAAFLDGRTYRAVVAVTSSAMKEVFPRLAAMVDAPMASDVVGIESCDSEAVVLTRAVFVGNLLASVELTGPQVLVTCRASEFDALPHSNDDSAVETVEIDAALAPSGKQLLAEEHVESERPDLKDADVVVSIGRGARGPDEGVALCEKLADTLGAALGATRAAVDAGWIANEFQVGQTGKIVAPKLYIAVGLSGSIQHIAGMRNSKAVVAINKDAAAPIFDVADIGLVGDLFEAVPRLTELLGGPPA